MIWRGESILARARTVLSHLRQVQPVNPAPEREQILLRAACLNLQVSSCCTAPLRVYGSDEGTNCYVCTKCGQPADAAGPEQTKSEDLPWSVEAVREFLQRYGGEYLLTAFENARRTVEPETGEREAAELAEADLPDADTAAAEYEETKRRVIAGTASVQEAQGFIDFIEGAIPNKMAKR